MSSNHKHRKLRVAAWVFLAIAGFMVAFLLTMYVIGKNALEAQLKTMRDAGEPMSLTDLYAQRPALPEERNSVAVILPAAAQLNHLPAGDPRRDLIPLLGDAGLPGLDEPWSPEIVDAIADYLDEHQEVLERLAAVRNMPQGRFSAPPSGFLDPALEEQQTHWNAVRLAAKLEALAALDAALKNSPSDAVVHLETLLNIGSSLADEYLLMPAMIELATQHLASTTTEQALSLVEIEPGRLGVLQQLFLRHERSDFVASALRGERLMMMDMFTGMAGRGGTKRPGGSLAPAFSWVGGGWFQQNEAKMLELFGPVIRAADDPLEAFAAAKRMDAEIAGMSNFFMLGKLAAPSISRAMESWAKTVALLRCTRTALAAERFRMRHGTWPSDLEELIPELMTEVPTDVFGPQPLQYVARDGGILIYSFGANETDDGGDIEFTDTDHRISLDIGFRLLDPELRRSRIASEASGD